MTDNFCKFTKKIIELTVINVMFFHGKIKLWKVCTELSCEQQHILHGNPTVYFDMI